MRRSDTNIDPAVQDSGTELQFRAITARGKRRGIRLERIFWDALAAAASADGRSVSEKVGIVHDGIPQGGNLASALRVVGARWMRDRLRLFERATVPANIYAILQACPAPAFALSEDKRIVHYNLAFLNFVQASFIGVEQSEAMRGLRLSLDTQLEAILTQLREDPLNPVATGFALGVVGRRVRGELKAILSPTPDQPMVIAFVMRT
ncbi:MAG: ribbon-helix-helix domain-containing protein [Rhizobiaceae bacterium]